MNFGRATLLLLLALSSNLHAESSGLKALILMPGPVTEAHADEEKNCDSCHSSFDKSAQDILCLECHEEVAEDRNTQKGFHGRSASASKAACKSCHGDHKGRDYDIVSLDTDTFDHNDTNFMLEGKHTNIRCESCHLEEKLYREAGGECYDCHQDEDPHRESLGEECGSCHESYSWQKRKTFDHDATEFPLRGHHEKLQCNECHAGEEYTFQSIECVSCHGVMDIHLGKYGQSCDQCHSQTDWSEPEFDHGAETDFKLTGKHQEQSCQACHFNGMSDNTPSMDCNSCHQSSDVHAGRHGSECESCHDTKGWDKPQFDHGKETNWPLTGEHEDIPCLQCHRGSLDDELNTDCQVCHKSDDVHQSDSLSDCANCHQPETWSKTPTFDHELSVFPLEGMHAIAPCQSCHKSFQYNNTDNKCDACHSADDTHDSSLGQQCESCHNPNAWSLWLFDHDTRTDFELSGAHEDLACASCHQGNDPDDVPGTCAGCHAADDRHRGSFGKNCGRCHTSESFGDVRWQN